MTSAIPPSAATDASPAPGCGMGCLLGVFALAAFVGGLFLAGPLCSRLDDAGRIVLDDGLVCEPDPAAARVPAGPVVVVPLGAARAPTYRTAPTLGRVLVVPGTLSEVAAAAHAAAVSRYLAAVAVLSLTAATLVAALFHGLVLP